MNVKIFRILLVITALSIIFLATKYAFANLSYLKVDTYLTRWQKSNVVDPLEMRDALASVDTMLSLHGHFPHYLNVAAKVYEWQAFTHTEDKSRYELYSLTALQYYLKSSQLRSHWPLTWAFMANIKASLNQFDDDFYFYIQQAIKYGPYTHEVNLQLAKLQLLYWGRLDKLPIKVGIEQIKRALKNNKVSFELLIYSKNIRRTSIVCSIAKLNDIKPVMLHSVCR